jgi:CBS-domain-containing membrane protein
MKVADIMTREVQCCAPHTNLAAAAKMMWDRDCGILPVLNVDGHVLGVITDRDICMAAATRNKPPSDITVWETISNKVYTCRASDDVHVALETMTRHQLRRLPVVDEDGTLSGMVSMNDLILHAGETRKNKPPELLPDDVMRALKGISAHRVLVGI